MIFYKLVVKFIFVCVFLGFGLNTYGDDVLEGVDVSSYSSFTYNSIDGDYDFSEFLVELNYNYWDDIRAVVVPALNGNADDVDVVLKQSYIEFEDVLGSLIYSYDDVFPVRFRIGKQRLKFGSINAIEPYKLYFPTKSVDLSVFLSADDIVATGGVFQYSSVLYQPYSISFGLWRSQYDDDSEESGLLLRNHLFSFNLSSSFTLEDSTDLKYGVSFIKSNISSSDDEDQISLFAFDLSYTYDLFGVYDSFMSFDLYFSRFMGETNYENLSGGHFISTHRILDDYIFGIRIAQLGESYDGDSYIDISLLLSKEFSDDVLLKSEYRFGENVDSGVFSKLVFGF